MSKEADKYFRKWSENCRIFTDYKPLHSHEDMMQFAEDYRTEQLPIHNVSQQRELLIAFLEMNNWLSLEDEENAKGVVDCYLKAINCG